MRPAATSVLLALFAAACGDDGPSCPEGTMRDGGRCVPVGVDGGPEDGGPIDGGGRDMPVADLGVCGECPAATPVCEESTGECVACLTSADCTEAEAPACLVNDTDSSANACVGCVDGDDCGGDTPICHGTEFTCVACEADADCTDPAAAKCDGATFECVACDDSPQCAGTGENVCDAAGTCVECTAGDESACGSDVCDVAAQTCTSIPAGGTGLCQECVSDRQCSPGRVCVAMAFEGTDVGNYCLWRQDATEVGAPMGDCLNSPPYREASSVTSVSGATTTVCSLRRTTCPALDDFDRVSCTTPGASDDECGVAGLDDGLCRMASSTMNRCTIPCDSDDDCFSGGCNTAETPRYCNF